MYSIIIEYINLFIPKANDARRKSEARRLVTQGGISINDDKIDDPNFVCEKSDFVLHKGKKTIIRIIRK